MTETQKRDIGAGISILAVSLFVHLLYYNVGFSLTDEGFLAGASARVLQGDRPYVDFATVYPPGSYYFFALLFKLFSVNLIVIRMTWVIILALCSLLIYIVGRKYMDWRFAALAALCYVVLPGAWHKSFIFFFSLLNIYLLTRFVEKKTFGSLALSAAVCCITLYFRQDVAGFTAISAILVLVSYKWLYPDYWQDVKVCRFTLYYIGIVSLAFVPPVFMYITDDAFRVGIDAMFNFMFNNINKLSVPRPDLELWPLKTHIPNIVFYLFIANSAAVLVLTLSSLSNRRNIVFIPVLLMGLMSLNHLRVRTDLPHMLQVSFMFVLFFFYMMSVLYGKLKSRFTSYVFGGMVCLLAITFTVFTYVTPWLGYYSGSIGTIKEKEYLVSLPRAKVWLGREEGAEIESVVNELATIGRPGEYLLTVPYFNAFNFLSGMKDPNYYSWVSPDTINTPEREKGLIDALEKTNTRLVVFSDIRFDGFEDRRLAVYAPKVYKYLMDNFTPRANYGQYQILERSGVAR